MTTTRFSQVDISEMSPAMIRPFHGVRDGRENPKEYVEEVEFHVKIISHQHTAEHVDRLSIIVFRHYLQNAAYQCYTNLPDPIRQNWTTLKTWFLDTYRVTEQDIQLKKQRITLELLRIKQAPSETLEAYILRVDTIWQQAPDPETILVSNFLQGLHNIEQKCIAMYEFHKGEINSYQEAVRYAKTAWDRAQAYGSISRQMDRLRATNTRLLAENHDLRSQLGRVVSEKKVWKRK